MLDAGHELTVIHPFPVKNKNPKRRDIVIHEVHALMEQLQKDIDPFKLGKNGPFLEQFYIYNIAKMSVDATLSNQEVKDLLNSNEKFDAVIYEIFGTDSLAGLGQHFACPVMGYTTFGTTRWANQITGNPDSYSTIANPFLGYTAKMTFTQRIKNVLFSYVEKVLIQLVYFPFQVRIKTLKDVRLFIKINYMNFHPFYRENSTTNISQIQNLHLRMI